MFLLSLPSPLSKKLISMSLGKYFFKSSVQLLNTRPLSYMCFADFFSPRTKDFNFNEVQFISFLLERIVLLMLWSKSASPNPGSCRFSLFSSESVSFMFRSFIHFELILIHVMRYVSRFVFACGHPADKAPFWKKLNFLHWIASALLPKIP